MKSPSPSCIDVFLPHLNKLLPIDFPFCKPGIQLVTSDYYFTLLSVNVSE